MIATIDVAAEPLLDPEEAYVLAEQIEAGVLARAALLDPDVPWRGDATPVELLLLEEEGERARQRFIAANLRLIPMVTRSFSRSGSGPDLFQEGCLGLIAAVERFDHRRGVRFATYALFWVRASVGAAAARQIGAAELPTSRAEQLRAARGLEAELAQRLGRPATLAELADHLGRTPAWTAALLASQPPQSLDVLDQAVLDALAPDLGEPTASDTTWVRDLLTRLTGLERQVVELRLGFADGNPSTLAAVARTLGVPVGRVRRAEQRALERLRAACPAQALDQVR